jgi:hypothetical protein
MQINPEKAREEFRTANQKNGGTGVKDFMDSMGLGVLAEQVHHHIYVYFVFSHLRISIKRFVPVQFSIWLMPSFSTAWRAEIGGIVGHTTTWPG